MTLSIAILSIRTHNNTRHLTLVITTVSFLTLSVKSLSLMTVGIAALGIATQRH